LDRRLRVTGPHRPDSGFVLEAGRGARLRFERRPTMWAGWVWCPWEGGAGAWVPESWVRIEGDTCVMLRDYTSREVPVDRGDRVISRFTESGWAWVRTEGGDEGWVPLENLEETRE